MSVPEQAPGVTQITVDPYADLTPLQIVAISYGISPDADATDLQQQVTDAMDRESAEIENGLATFADNLTDISLKS